MYIFQRMDNNLPVCVAVADLDFAIDEFAVAFAAAAET